MFSKSEIEKYFMAEKSAAMWLMIIATVLFIASLVFWIIQKNDISKGAFFPLVLLLIVAFASQYAPYKQSDSLRKTMVYAFDMNPPKLKQDEAPRLEKLKKQISLRLIIELVFLVAGAVLIFLYYNKSGTALMLGLGTGMIVAALVALTFDYLSSLRVLHYLEGIRLMGQR